MLGLLHLPQKPLEGEYLVAWELEIIAEGEGDEGKVWLDSREMFNLTQALDRICAEAQYAGFQAADAAMKAARAE
jgi:hypothetical protein